MTTGWHTVCDVFCVVCGPHNPVGWKYVFLKPFRLQLNRRTKSTKKIVTFWNRPSSTKLNGMQIDRPDWDIVVTCSSFTAKYDNIT